MVEMNLIILIVWAELTFLLAGGLFMFVAARAARKHKDKKAAKLLLERVGEDRGRREEQIRDALSRYGLQGDYLESQVEFIDRAEKLLYQRIANMYVQRNFGRLAGFNVSFEQAISPYLKLDLDNALAGAGAVAETNDEALDDGELENLRKENKQLSGDLSTTMDTMGKMLNEYSSMFGEADEDGLDGDKIMEAFEVDADDEEKTAGEDAATVSEATATPEAEQAVETADDPVSDEPSDELIEIDDAILEQHGDSAAQIDVQEADVAAGTQTEAAESKPAPDADADLEMATDVDDLVEIEQDQPEQAAAKAAPEAVADDLEIEIGEDEPEPPAEKAALGDLEIVADDDELIEIGEDEKNAAPAAAEDDFDIEIGEDEPEEPAAAVADDFDIEIGEESAEPEKEAASASDKKPQHAGDVVSDIASDFHEDLAELDALAGDLAGLDAELADEASDFTDELVDLGVLDGDADDEMEEKEKPRQSTVEIEGMDDLDLGDLVSDEPKKSQ
ncbi:MAG: hypothetical protein PVG66_05370 [Chromatiales bacterium]|jgi:hypothetical protein